MAYAPAAAAAAERDYPLKIPSMATAQEPARLATHPAQLAQALELQRRAFAADAHPSARRAARPPRTPRAHAARERRRHPRRDRRRLRPARRARKPSCSSSSRASTASRTRGATCGRWMRAERRAVAWWSLPGRRAAHAPAARRGRHHRALELPAVSRGVAAHRGARRGQPRDAQDVGAHAALRRAVRVARRAQLSGRRGGRRQRRRDRGAGLRRPALRPPAVHRLDRRRPRGHEGGEREPDAGDARTRRQVAGDRDGLASTSRKPRAASCTAS